MVGLPTVLAQAQVRVLRMRCRLVQFRVVPAGHPQVPLLVDRHKFPQARFPPRRGQVFPVAHQVARRFPVARLAEPVFRVAHQAEPVFRVVHQAARRFLVAHQLVPVFPVGQIALVRRLR